MYENPYMGNQYIQQIPRYNGMQYQQMQQPVYQNPVQQAPTQQQAAAPQLIGRTVNSVDEITANDVPMNYPSLALPPYLGRQKFGTTKQDSLEIRYIVGENSQPVALKASNFDAQAPLRDIGGFKDIQNEMPFYRESYMVTEKEEQQYADYALAENSSLANQVLRQISKKPMNLIQGAMVVPERQIWELLAPADGVPKVTVNIEGKKYVVDYTTDNGTVHKKDHYIEISGTSDKWDAPETATPLDDLIKTRRDFAKKTGYSLTRFSMNTETFEMLLNAEDTKKQVLGITAYNGGIRVRQEDVLAYLRGYGIEIEVYDKMYVDESGVTQYFIPKNIISCQSAGVYLGDYVFGRTPEERSGSLANGNLSIVETGIAVYTYATEHPINTHCVVSMIGLPSFEGMNSVVVMKVA